MEDEWPWSFVLPWCEPARGRLRFVTGLMEDAPGLNFRGLQVELPSADFEDADEMMRELQESLGVLAAVADVDNAAWKRLLVDYVDLDVSSQEETFEGEVAPRFQLALIDDGPDSEEELLAGLEAFCRTEQHSKRSEEYENVLARIAAQAVGKCYSRTTEIETPVTIQLGPWITSSSDEMLRYLRSLQERVRAIRTQWRGHSERNKGPLSVTFVLESILLDLRDVSYSADLAELLESFADDGIRFSGLAMRQELGHSLLSNGSRAAAREAVGRTVWGLFGGTNTVDKGYTFEATTMTGPLLAMYGHPRQLSLDSLHFDCDAMRNWVFERVCSAVAVNQTTTHLSLRLELEDGDDSDDGDWALVRWRWQWIIYGCFSEKARLHSRLERLTLRNAVITGEAVEAMAAVLASNRPEETLLGIEGYPSDGSTDVSIKPNASVTLRPMHVDESIATHSFKVARELTGVTLLSGADANGWVDVLLPGFGQCRVQQSSLVNRSVSLPPNGLAGVTSLTISFGEDPDPETLLALLTLIGASLTHLSLEFESFNTRELEGIVAVCSSLVELAVCTGAIEMRFSLRDSNYRDLVLDDAAHISFNDIQGIAETLCDGESPLTQCARRLRVRMGYRASSHVSDDWFTSLLTMLEVNNTLEYLDVVTGRPFMVHFNDFKAHHLESLPVVDAPVPVASKLAFLSVMDGQYDEPTGMKKRKHQQLFSALDQHALECIFEYATACVARRVYFREYDFFQTGRHFIPI